MQTRALVGIAAGIAVAAGIVALAASRAGEEDVIEGTVVDTPHPQPGPPPTLPAPDLTSIDGMVSDYFTRYDHDGSRAIDLRPKFFDEAIQQLANVSTDQAAEYAKDDERITDYTGDSLGDGMTLQARSAVELFMQAAQKQAHSPLDLKTLMLRPEALRAEIATFDHNGDDHITGTERESFDQRYPEDPVNYRWVRVLHLGEWEQLDD